MEETSLTVTAWLRLNKNLVKEVAERIKRQCESSDELVSRLITQLRVAMLEAGVISAQIDNLNVVKMRRFCNMVEIRLPSVISGTKAPSPAFAELKYSGYDQDTQEFWDGQPQRAKKAAGKKATEEVQELIDLMRGVLVKQKRKWSVGLDPGDVTRALDAALNGGQIKALVSGLRINDTKLAVKRQIARLLLEDVRVILKAMPTLIDDIGRNHMALAVHCALNNFPPPTDLVTQAAIVLLRSVDIDVVVALQPKKWFRRPEA